MPKIERAEDVQYFSHHAGELKHSQQHKIQKFIEHDCIQYAGDGVFQCLPIPGYNTRTYCMTKGTNGEFLCTC